MEIVSKDFLIRAKMRSDEAAVCSNWSVHALWVQYVFPRGLLNHSVFSLFILPVDKGTPPH